MFKLSRSVIQKLTIVSLAGLLSGCASAPETTSPAAGVKVTTLVSGSVMQAVEGIDLGADGMIYGTSIHGQAVYRINPQTGFVDKAVADPEGESDDVAYGPVGTPVEGVLAWTAQRAGELRALRPGGQPEVVLPNAPRVNPVAFSKDGRLFTAQSGAGENALWEIDMIGDEPPRIIAQGKGRLNGFGFGPDGRLYAPWFGEDKLFAIDVDTGDFEIITEGIGDPAAAKVRSDGTVFSVDYITGDVWRTEMPSGKSRIITKYPEPLDNLTIAPDGTIYLASVADSSIFAYHPETGRKRDVAIGRFTVPLGMTTVMHNGRESLLVSDPFGFRYVDVETGIIDRPPWARNRDASSAIAATDDFIAFTYTDSKRIRKLDRRTDELVADSRALENPRGVALTSEGDVIVADPDGMRLVKLIGEDVETLVGGLQEPVALLLESDSLALVTEVASGTISRVDLISGRRDVLVSGLEDPRGLAVMKDGRLAVVEPEPGRVTAVDPVTGEKTVLADDLPLSIAHMHLPKNTPLGITVGSDGSLYVACGTDNRIVKLSLNDV